MSEPKRLILTASVLTVGFMLAALAHWNLSALVGQLLGVWAFPLAHHTQPKD